jgi:hypothetical protein
MLNPQDVIMGQIHGDPDPVNNYSTAGVCQPRGCVCILYPVLLSRPSASCWQWLYDVTVWSYMQFDVKTRQSFFPVGTVTNIGLRVSKVM